jgi:hypothetical protein
MVVSPKNPPTSICTSYWPNWVMIAQYGPTPV